MSASDDRIFHIALPDDWAAARSAGSYTVSTRGATLDEVGFIHCSRAHQLAKVANFAYSDLTEVLILELEPELLDAEIVDEPPSPDSDEIFPHIYGPITTAVVAEEWWERGSDGVWRRPPFLS